MDAPEIGQSEEVTEPSDEGNSEEITDDISNKDPVEEELVVEEPSEGDVEEVEEPTIDVMVDGDEGTGSETEEGTYTVTLPANPQGYTITGDSKTTKDQPYTFTVTAQTGYRIKTVKYTIGSEEETLDIADNGSYTIEAAKITADITISVEAVQTFTVTVTAPDTVTVQYIVGNEDAQDVVAPVTVDKGDKVKLTVTPKEDRFVVTVKKGTAKLTGTKNVYDLGAINADVAVTVETAKNKYTITENIKEIKVIEGEETKDIVPAAIDYAKSGTANISETETDPKHKMIAKSKPLKFEVISANGVDLKDKKVIVTYKVGAEGDFETLTADKDGVYTIAAAKITDDITLEVEVRDYEKYAVTLQTNSDIEEAKYFSTKDNDFVNFPELAQDAEDSVVSDVAEDSVFRFKLEAKAYYKITSVKVDGTALTAKNGEYSFNVTKNATIEVATELDKTQFKTLTFKLTGDAGSATAVLSDIENDFEKLNNQPVVVGKVYDIAAQKDEKVTLTITPKDGYTIDKVNGVVPKNVNAETGVVTHEVKFAAAKAATVTVITKVIAAEGDRDITFETASDASHVNYNVTGDNKIAKVTGEDNKYTVKNGAQKLLFTITATDSYEPAVNQISEPVKEEGDDEEENDNTRDVVSKPIEASKTTIKGTTATYEYVIPASLLAEGDKISISEAKIQNKVMIVDADNADVVVSRNGRAESSATEYTVGRGETVAISVTQKGNCTLSTVKYAVGDVEKTVTAKNGVAAFSVVVTADTTVTVDAKADYKPVTLKNATDDTEVKPDTKGVYPVSYDGTYKVGLTEGTDTTTLVEVAAIKVFDSKNKEVEGGYVTINLETATAPTIKLTDAVANQKLTARLYVAGEGEDLVDTGVAYTLQVSNTVTTINVSNVNNQPTDTTKKYKITTNTNADLGKLQATTTADDVIKEVKVVGNELVITTGQKATPEDGVKVTVSAGTGDNAVTKEITVKSTALLNNKQKPTVTQKGATDIELTLTLGAKNIDDAENGTVLYAVTVDPKKVDGEDTTNRMETALTKYYVKDGDSQDVTINVAREDDDNPVNLGDGEAWSFDVTVQLVHATAKHTGKDAITVPDDGLIEGEASDTSKTLVAKTKTPAWENNLKLKKGTTTIYTGQSYVTIATPQFSKTTTYTEITVDNIKDIESPAGGNMLTDFKVNDDGTIAVAAATNTAVGKHTIEVTALAHKDGSDYTMYASKATIVVTVVRGIDTLAVDVPSKSLYKAAGKAGTIKATPIYNPDANGNESKATAPKTKKVEWKVVKSNSDDDFDPKVTIKNGTVTVAKDYILKPTDAENTFRIKVSVDNGKDGAKFIGSAKPQYSEPITITNKGAQVAAVAIVQVQKNESNEVSYKVVARPTKDDKDKIVPTPKEATEINGGLVYAFNTTDIAEEYKAEDFNKVIVPLSDLTFKSSKAKNVAFDTTVKNAIVVNSPANGVKLTVTANDGSKKKAELTLNVNPDETTSNDLALKITKVKDSGVVYDAGTTKIADNTVKVDAYNDSAVSRVKIEVQAWNEDATDSSKSTYETVPRYANYTLKVKKGGKLSPIGDGTYIATLDKRDIEITLTNKDKTAWTYQLTNEDVLPASATKITAKALNTLHPAGTKEAQKVTIQLGNVDLTKYEDYEAVSASVEVDWSKKNDKNAIALDDFALDLSKSSYPIGDDIDATKKTANIELSFSSANPKFDLSSYALKVTLCGTKKVTEGTEQKEVTEAISQPAAVTVKVDKVKKFTFKPTTSYTFGAKDGYAVLGGKSSIPEDELNLAFTDLLNIAKKDGKENDFTKKFDIDNGKLVLKQGVIASEIAKDDLTGYLVYTATTDKSYYDNKDQSGLVKITVKVNGNAVVKYTHDGSASINNNEGATATVQIQVNSKDAMDTAWSNKETTNKGVEIAKAEVKSTKDPIKVKDVTTDGKLVLEMTADVVVPAKGKKVSADIYIVPKNSSHLDKFVGDNVTPSLKDYKDYAATVKVTLKVTEVPPTAASIAQKIQTEVGKATITPIEYTPGENGAEGTITNADTVKESIEDAIKDAKIAGIDAYEVTVAEPTIVTHPSATDDGSASSVVTVKNEDNSDTETTTITLKIEKLTEAEG